MRTASVMDKSRYGLDSQSREALQRPVSATWSRNVSPIRVIVHSIPPQISIGTPARSASLRAGVGALPSAKFKPPVPDWH